MPNNDWRRVDYRALRTAANKPLRRNLDLDLGHACLARLGLKPETVAAFGAGYCASGVMAQCIAVPIHNTEDELVGYVAHRLRNGNLVNTSQCHWPVEFNKSLEVFRLGEAMCEPPAQPLILVEGFIEAMRLWQLGARKIVALMGKSLSGAQEERLMQAIPPNSKLVVMFDENEAGRDGRMEVVHRLSHRNYVHVVAFADEGFQVKHITSEEASLLGVLPE